MEKGALGKCSRGWESVRVVGNGRESLMQIPAGVTLNDSTRIVKRFINPAEGKRTKLKEKRKWERGTWNVGMKR